MKLSKLFDFQKFAQNKDMSKIIDDVEDKYYNSSKRELSLEEMSYVAAAGANTLESIENDNIENDSIENDRFNKPYDNA